MKKLFMAVIALMMTISASAQFYIYCSDGNVIKVDSISMVAPSYDETPGIGTFSVSADKQVTFSKGNLQYTQSTNTWSFAENQWDMIGTDNVTGGSVTPTPYGAGYYKEGTALADKVDSFGWSTSATHFGVSASTSNSDYSGSFIDWGTNTIGNDAPNTWRTLTKDEWEYLLDTRPNASSLKGVARVNGVNGLILLPDNWVCPAGVTFKSGFSSEWGEYLSYQIFTADQWSKLESVGAVFLPASGIRFGSGVYDVQDYGRYWSATVWDIYRAYCLYLNSDEARMYVYDRDDGFSVRLVKDVEGENIEPEQPGEGDEEPGEPDPGTPDTPEEPTPVVGVFSVAEGKTVTFSPGNLQYTQSTNTWSFAENQWDYIGTDNVTDGSVSSDPTYGDSKEGTALADKVDLFGWSTSATHFGVSTSTDENDYSGSFVDWGTNTIGNDAPNTWRTLTIEEWYYLFNNRNNANDLYGVAQVNDVNGLIFLPDNWTCPAGVTFKSGFHVNSGAKYYAAYQTFTADQWSTLEKSGAVFLPAAGYRDGSKVGYVQNGGYYWSATAYGYYTADCLCFLSGVNVNYVSRYRGHSVRLVKDVE